MASSTSGSAVDLSSDLNSGVSGVGEEVLTSSTSSSVPNSVKVGGGFIPGHIGSPSGGGGIIASTSASVVISEIATSSLVVPMSATSSKASRQPHFRIPKSGPAQTQVFPESTSRRGPSLESKATESARVYQDLLDVCARKVSPEVVASSFAPLFPKSEASVEGPAAQGPESMPTECPRPEEDS